MCVCAVTDFSDEDKASGVKFCTVFQRRPGQGISHFWELCSAEAQSDESARGGDRPGTPLTCVDNLESPSLTVLVYNVIYLYLILLSGSRITRYFFTVRIPWSKIAVLKIAQYSKTLHQAMQTSLPCMIVLSSSR